MKQILTLVVLFALVSSAVSAVEPIADGFVFEDLNGDGVRGLQEPGIADVAVSNGQALVITDANGAWSLPYDDEDTIFFVIKPSGWMTPVSEDQLPRFYYIHKPAGASINLGYEGVKPTGTLPASIDFALVKAEESEEFSVVLFADPQPSSIKQVNYVADGVISELIGETGAKFGVTLGDIVHEKLDLLAPSNANVGLLGIPWYNVIGNHDVNVMARVDKDSDETFHRFYGPNYYSFNYGAVHFVVLDNVDWHGNTGSSGRRRPYRAGIDPDQLTFVENDLALVPDEKLVVLMMHIPIYNLVEQDKQKLFRLMEKRSHILSMSGHTHMHSHHFLGEDDGWQGQEPHHHIVNGAVSGSWWKGAKDGRGIPHATMRDGTPNGYSVIQFDGSQYMLDFKAAGSPVEYKIGVFAPNEVDLAQAGDAFVYVNVFNGSERSEVKLRLDGQGAWLTMEKVLESDPHYVAAREREKDASRKLNDPVPSTHLWKANIFEELTSGSHYIDVEATDMYGRTFQARRIIRVTDSL
ncbi:calcineurin-like phosphoesterase C-terminal domain-containing protein [Coraliomargarita sp. W4R53]